MTFKEEMIFWWRKLRFLLLMVFPISIVLSIIYFHETGSRPDLSFDWFYLVINNWYIVLGVTVLVAIFFKFLFGIATRISMKGLKREKDEIQEKSDIAEIRLGVGRGGM